MTVADKFYQSAASWLRSIPMNMSVFRLHRERFGSRPAWPKSAEYSDLPCILSSQRS